MSTADISVKLRKTTNKDKVIELSNGSTIRMGSVNQVDSCVGRSYDLIIFDEAALADGRDAFNVAERQLKAAIRKHRITHNKGGVGVIAA